MITHREHELGRYQLKLKAIGDPKLDIEANTLVLYYKAMIRNKCNGVKAAKDLGRSYKTIKRMIKTL